MQDLGAPISNFKHIKDHFAIVTFVTIALGYIGFFTYAARFSLPFVYPHISQAVGIGILSLIILISFYLISGGPLKRKSTSFQSAFLYLIITLLINQLNPISFFLAIYFYIDNFESILIPLRKRQFAQRRKLFRALPRRRRITVVSVIIIMLLFGFFVNVNTLISWLFIDIAVGMFRRVRLRILEVHKIIIVTLLTPIFLVGFVMNDFSFTLLGLTRTNIIATRKDGTQMKGLLVFKDASTLYMQDTIGNQSSFSFGWNPRRTIAIASDQISAYGTDSIVTPRPEAISFLELLSK